MHAKLVTLIIFNYFGDIVIIQIIFNDGLAMSLYSLYFRCLFFRLVLHLL